MKPVVETQEPAPREAGAREHPSAPHRSGRRRAAAWLAAGALALTGTLAVPPSGADTLAVSVGGPAEDPAYLPVHAAQALGTFEAEGVTVRLRVAKHPAGALAALREGTATVAVTTSDQAVRGAWARGLPVRILAAHTQAPAVALLVSVKHEQVASLGDLRGTRVGIPGPGTTGHLVLLALLAAQRLGPADVNLVSLPGASLASRLASGDLAAAVVEEPWVGRALASGAGRVWIDLRSADQAARRLGGPFYEVVSVIRAETRPAKEAPPPDPGLEAFVRAVTRVQAWLATATPSDVSARLPDDLVRDSERLAARIAVARQAWVPDARATEAGLTATLAVLRHGSPWPVSLKLRVADLIEPPFVAAARARLGPTPPPP